jgi:hypothetical protein
VIGSLSAWTIGTAGFKGDGHPDFFLVSSIFSVLGELHVELWLAVQRCRRVVTHPRTHGEGPPEEVGSRPTLDSSRVRLCIWKGCQKTLTHPGDLTGARLKTSRGLALQPIGMQWQVGDGHVMDIQPDVKVLLSPSFAPVALSVFRSKPKLAAQLRTRRLASALVQRKSDTEAAVRQILALSETQTG